MQIIFRESTVRKMLSLIVLGIYSSAISATITITAPRYYDSAKHAQISHCDDAQLRWKIVARENKNHTNYRKAELLYLKGINALNDNINKQKADEICESNISKAMSLLISTNYNK